MILKIFLYGMLIAIPAIFLEIGFFAATAKIPVSGAVINILNIFIGVALIEEVLKYFVVREKVLRDPELDEPIDLMLYMIIAALGFASVENILVLFLPAKQLLISEASFITAFRFIGATFLHALASGTIGYSLAKYFFTAKVKFLIFGFSAAILLHGAFNFLIIMIDERIIGKTSGFLLIVGILASLALFVHISFRKLEKLPSVSKITTN